VVSAGEPGPRPHGVPHAGAARGGGRLHTAVGATIGLGPGASVPGGAGRHQAQPGPTEWYDTTFGAGGALVRQFQQLDAAVRQARAAELARGRRAPALPPASLPGSPPTDAGADRRRLPVDYRPSDRAELRGETVPDGTVVGTGQTFVKSWRLGNAGDRPWLGRYLTRQGRPGSAGWLLSPPRLPVPPVWPGQEVEITAPFLAPATSGVSVAHFTMTDEAGRPYFPGDPIGTVHCSVLVVDRAAR